MAQATARLQGAISWNHQRFYAVTHDLSLDSSPVGR